MEKIVFEDNYASYFERHGLRNFDDFFTYQEGDLINQNTKRNVVVLRFSNGDREKTLFMKRFFNPHLKDMLFTLRNFGKFCSQAELEYRNASLLIQNGIETYHAVCYGFRSFWGIERESFVITEKINGTCLLDYLMQSWRDLSRLKQEKLVRKLARFFKKIHTAGLSLPDAYIWHIYMIHPANEMDDYKFGIIDLHRMRIRIRGTNQAAMNLGRFLYSLPEGFMDTRLQSLFMETYLTDNFEGGKQNFVKHVRKRIRKLSKRRKKSITHLS